MIVTLSMVWIAPIFKDFGALRSPTRQPSNTRLSSSLSTPTKAATEQSPHVFETRLGSDLLRPSQADIDEMFDEYDRLCGTVQQPPLGPSLRSVLWRYCDGHFGILRLTLFHIAEIIALLLHAMSAAIASCDELVSLGLCSCSFDIHRLNADEFASRLCCILFATISCQLTRPEHPHANLLEFVLNALRLLKVCALFHCLFRMIQ